MGSKRKDILGFTVTSTNHQLIMRALLSHQAGYGLQWDPVFSQTRRRSLIKVCPCVHVDFRDEPDNGLAGDNPHCTTARSSSIWSITRVFDSGSLCKSFDCSLSVHCMIRLCQSTAHPSLRIMAAIGKFK